MNDGQWKTVYDSVEGTSHSGADVACQDVCRVVQLSGIDGDLMVACCADGAGSATHAAEGAEIACDTFLSIVEEASLSINIGEDVTSDVIVGWIGAMRSRVEARADQLQVPLRQLASTFLGAVVAKSSSLFVQVGDGAIVIRRGDQFQPVFWPQSGEYANTTNFLTDELVGERLEWKRLQERVDEFAIFTDGLERLILRFADRSVHGPFLEPFFVTLRQTRDCEPFFGRLREFLNSPSVNERTPDDKTLILATRLSHCSEGDAIH